MTMTTTMNALHARGSSGDYETSKATWPQDGSVGRKWKLPLDQH